MAVFVPPPALVLPPSVHTDVVVEDKGWGPVLLGCFRGMGFAHDPASRDPHSCEL